MSAKSVRGTFSNRIYTGLLLLFSAAIVFIALLIPTLSRSLAPPPQPGDVAAQDFRAPEPVTFLSEVLTQQRRESAQNALPPVYTSPDTGIARRQLERLQTTLAFITSVRADRFASQQQKVEDLASLSDLQLKPGTAINILNLTDTRWQEIQQETKSTLERVMRGPIRPDELDKVRETVPTLVSLSFPEMQADIVAELAAAFVIPNSEYSEELTQSVRQKASESIAPVNRSFAVGQTVVQRGQILSEADVEALEQLRLIQPQPKWQNLASAAALVILILGITAGYLNRQRALQQHYSRSLFLVTALFLITLIIARLNIPSHTVIPYAYPMAAYGLTVAALLGPELAMFTSVPLGLLTAYGLPNALDLTVYYVLGSIAGVLTLGPARRVIAFFRGGAAVAIAGVIIIFAYRLPQPTTDWAGLATLSGASIFNGLASASIALVLQVLLAQFLDMTTPLQLMDLTRPDQPLLQKLLQKAPGTYQHSLQVANLAEQAAEKVDVDPLLTRVGALYHDIGKSRAPSFFIENQVAGFPNPHEALDPATSAAVIIRHVPDGLELAKKHRMPRRIQDFIAEHHGTLITPYQYAQAVNENDGNDEDVDIEMFRYPGPEPQSRETAIVMLADGCEARVRSERPKDENELRELVLKTIEQRVADHQLDYTDLTMREISVIADSFAATLKGFYHPRIRYPEMGERASAEAITTPVIKSTSEGESETLVDAPADASSSMT